MQEPVPAPPRVSRRRRGSRGRRTFLVSVAVSMGLLMAVPLTHYIRTLPREGPTVGAPPENGSNLALSEAFFAGEGRDRHIAGIIRNMSQAPYKDVEVAFAVRSRSGDLLGLVTASITELRAGESAPFRTSPAPVGAVRLGLTGISGTRVDPPSGKA